MRANVKKGIGAAVSAWQISAGAKAPFDLRPNIAGAEQFIYVLDGGVEITVGADRQVTAAGTLLVVAPGSTAVQVRTTGVAATLLVFEAAKAP
ncbi:MAG TPA: hypothetical protein VNT81_24430 [Vicinamibacterales bacterium]|nr:hypothetical protein [Vicinamibacterales bacterium]